MHGNRWFLVLQFHCSIIAASAVCAGQTNPTAGDLFGEAVSKMEVGQFAEACPLLEESLRLDPKPGTLFTLANCLDREGKFAQATARYSQYLQQCAAMSNTAKSRHAARVNLADVRVKTLMKEISALELRWDQLFSPNVRLLIDNTEVSTPMLNFPLPLEPGRHELIVQRPGAPDIRRSVVLEKGQTVIVDLTSNPLPKHGNAEATDLSPTLTVNGGFDRNRNGASRLPSTLANGRRTLGFIGVGLGGAGLALGGLMGGLALAEKQTVKTHCTGAQGLDCDKTGFAAVENMRAYARTSTVGFIAGGLLAVSGVVLIVTGRAQTIESSTAIELRISSAPGAGFISAKGAF